MLKRTISEIERELQELYPKKELAYLDYVDNTGNTSGLRERLWNEFVQLKTHWNILIVERKRLLGI